MRSAASPSRESHWRSGASFIRPRAVLPPSERSVDRLRRPTGVAQAGALPRLVAGLAIAAALALLALPVPEGLAPEAMEAGALLVLAVGLWASGIVPLHLTALLFFLLAMLLGVAPASVVFSGFGSAAVWLVFGGLVIGVAVERTGLGERLARSLVGLFGDSYLRVLLGVATVGVTLAFLMPSTMGRVVLLVPIMAATAGRLGFAPGSRGRHGIILATALSTFMPAAAILPSNVANMVLAGTAETLYGIEMRYVAYLVLHFPLLGAAKCVLIVLASWLLFHDRPRPAEVAPEARPLSGEERALATLLAVALALWATDAWHGVSPAWIALGAAVVAMLPPVRLVPAEAFNERLNFGSLFYVAGILGLAAVVERTGLGRVLAGALVELTGLAPGATAHDFAALIGVSMVLSLATTMGGVPAVLTPLADGLSQASGLPLVSVLMTQVLGFSTVLLPYQLPPLMVAMQLGEVPLRAGARLTLLLAAVTVGLVLPLNYLWWSWLGYLG